MVSAHLVSRPRRICVVGGSGFVGLHLAARLVRAGERVDVLTRREYAFHELKVLPGVRLLQTAMETEALAERFAGADAVVNLAGILNERRRGDFEAVHVALPQRIVAACRQAGVQRLLHMSALKADMDDPPSRYLQSKGEGERQVLAAEELQATVFRPSVIFGPEDDFFNRFDRLLRLSPGVFPLACPEARFAPVYVGDVAEAMVRALDLADSVGRGFELCGPRAYSLRQIVDYVMQVGGHRRHLLPLGPRASRLMAGFMEHLPGRPFTRDNYRSLQCNSLCKSRFPEIFGITPKAVEAVVPGYLGLLERNHRLSYLRRAARRDEYRLILRAENPRHNRA